MSQDQVYLGMRKSPQNLFEKRRDLKERDTYRTPRGKANLNPLEDKVQAAVSNTFHTT